jgi:hypothetical protein
MKITVRTSFLSGLPRTSSGRPPASAFTPRTRFYPRTGFTVRGPSINPFARTLGCIRADMARPHGRTLVSARTWASARTHAFPPSPPLSLLPLPPPLRTQSAVRPDTGVRPRFFIFLYFFGSCCRLGKREIYNLQQEIEIVEG